MYNFLCTTNEAFEDQLTSDKVYQAIELGISSIKIINDNGEAKWYGLPRFTLTLEVSA